MWVDWLDEVCLECMPEEIEAYFRKKKLKKIEDDNILYLAKCNWKHQSIFEYFRTDVRVRIWSVFKRIYIKCRYSNIAISISRNNNLFNNKEEEIMLKIREEVDLKELKKIRNIFRR